VKQSAYEKSPYNVPAKIKTIAAASGDMTLKLEVMTKTGVMRGSAGEVVVWRRAIPVVDPRLLCPTCSPRPGESLPVIRRPPHLALTWPLSRCLSTAQPYCLLHLRDFHLHHHLTTAQLYYTKFLQCAAVLVANLTPFPCAEHNAFNLHITESHNFGLLDLHTTTATSTLFRLRA